MTAKILASSSSDITYKPEVSANPNLNIKVKPQTLSFKSSGEKKSFTVTCLHSKSLAQISGIVSASLVWSDGWINNVRSPIVVY